MTLANKLGSSYESIKNATKQKKIKITFNDTECELKVRVPFKREMEEIMARISSPEKQLVEEIYTRLSAPIKETVTNANEGFLDAVNAEGEKLKITDTDVIVDGTSVRQVANISAIWQTQVEQYFSLLLTETGEPVNETFEQITDEFPEYAIREIVSKIDEAIKPKYEDTKKN